MDIFTINKIKKERTIIYIIDRKYNLHFHVLVISRNIFLYPVRVQEAYIALKKEMAVGR